MAGGPVSLTVVPNEVEAEVIRGLLATEGIESMSRPTNFGASATDGFTPSGAREILVRADRLDEARALIADAVD
ncbi:MAG: putative signal transducing protein [Gaiellaceae bacterium]